MSSDLLTGSVTITDKASKTLSAIESKFLSIIKAAEKLETVLKRIDKIKVSPTIALADNTGTASSGTASSGTASSASSTSSGTASSGTADKPRKTRGKYRTKKVIAQEEAKAKADAEAEAARKHQRGLDFRSKYNWRTDHRVRSSVSGRAATKDIANSRIQNVGGTKSGVVDRAVKGRTAKMNKAMAVHLKDINNHFKEIQKASALAKSLAEGRREQDRIMAAKRNKMLADANAADRRVAAANKKAAEENRRLIRAKSLGSLNRQFKADPSGLMRDATRNVANVGGEDKFGMSRGVGLSKLDSAKNKAADMATAKLVKGNLLLNKATKSTSSALRKLGGGIKTYTTETSFAAKSIRKGMDSLNAFRKSTSDRLERGRNDRRTRATVRGYVRDQVSTANAEAKARRLEMQRRLGGRDAAARTRRVGSGTSGDYMKNQLSNLGLKGAGSMKANAAILRNVGKELGTHLKVGATHIAKAGETITNAGRSIAMGGSRVAMAGSRVAMAGTTTAAKIGMTMANGGMRLRRGIAMGVSKVNYGIRGMLQVVSDKASKVISQLRAKASGGGRGGRGGGMMGGMTRGMGGMMGGMLAMGGMAAVGYGAYKLGSYLVKSSDEERTMRKKMVMMPDTFGVAKEDDKGRTDWLAGRYERAKRDSIEGLDGTAIIKSATDWAFKIGADPNKKGQGFDNFDQAEDFARTLQAMGRNTGASASEMSVMEYQLQQVGAKGHAEMLDIKPLIQSAPTLMAELGDAMGMSFDEMMNSGKDKSLTWDKMKDAVLALKEKHLALAKQEQMMTAQGQMESGMSYIKASIQEFNDFIHKIFVDNEVIFTFFKMLGDSLTFLGESLIGTSEAANGVSEETNVMRDLMIGLMTVLNFVVRVLVIIVDSIVTSVKIIWHDIKGLGKSLVRGLSLWKSIFKDGIRSVKEFFYGLKYNVPMAFRKLAVGILNAIYKILDGKAFGNFIGAKDKVESMMNSINRGIAADEKRKKEDPNLKRLAKERKVQAREDVARTIKFTLESMAHKAKKLDITKGFSGRTKKSFQQLENDYWRMKNTNKKHAKTDLEKIEEDTDTIAGGLKKANKSLEILREIAGYQVVNTVTRVRPNHVVNFAGDIRMDGVGENNVMTILNRNAKRMQNRLNGIGDQGNTTTVTVGSP